MALVHYCEACNVPIDDYQGGLIHWRKEWHTYHFDCEPGQDQPAGDDLYGIGVHQARTVQDMMSWSIFHPDSVGAGRPIDIRVWSVFLSKIIAKQFS